MREIIASAPGKINLLLRSGKVSSDGYHPLLTVFETMSLREYVVARTRRTPGVTVETFIYRPEVTGPPVFDADLTAKFAALAERDHLAVQAAKVLQPLAAAAAWGATSSGVHLKVHKTVPAAAGMAGGSADAAATLVALNEMWQLGLSASQLSAVGSRLGADVPACLLGGQSVGTGRGDRVRPLSAASNAPIHWWALAFAQEGLSTPAVFAEFDRLGLGEDDLPLEVNNRDAYLGPASVLASHLVNDLQPAALSLRPELAELGNSAIAGGAAAWVVSGSGPTVAALVPNETAAQAICAEWAKCPSAPNVAVASGPADGAKIEKRLPKWAGVH